MNDDLRIGREWTQDADRVFVRAQQHLAAFDTALTPGELDMALHDFTLAGQMYLAGALQYQRGSEAVAGPGSTSSADLIRHLEGHLQSEAVAALDASEGRAVRADARLSDVDRAQVLAQELRDRFSHAVPELFDRATAPTPLQSVTRAH